MSSPFSILPDFLHLPERLRRTRPSAKAPRATRRTAKADGSEGAATATREPRGSSTAAKRQMTHVRSVAAGSSTKLTDLLLTLVATIVEFVGPAAALALSRSCKVVRDILDPREVLGKRTWRKVREADGWPDPARIAMSDYTFLTSVFGRGCNFCSEHPQSIHAILDLDRFLHDTARLLLGGVVPAIDPALLVLLPHDDKLATPVHIPPNTAVDTGTASSGVSHDTACLTVATALPLLLFLLTSTGT
ncbi:hypothetical protein HK405_009434, partial [Cladochytrium tenue]